MAYDKAQWQRISIMPKLNKNTTFLQLVCINQQVSWIL
jgi:hypothetical protein